MIQNQHRRFTINLSKPSKSSGSLQMPNFNMIYTSILALALSVLSSALPIWDPPACKWHPQTFTINQLSIFTPAGTNPSPYKSISFKYDVTAASSSRSSTFGTTCTHTGLDILNPNDPFQCKMATSVGFGMEHLSRSARIIILLATM